MCAPKNKIGLLGSTYFVGLVLGSIFLPRLSDIYGRKSLTLLGGTLHLVASFMILLSDSF